MSKAARSIGWYWMRKVLIEGEAFLKLDFSSDSIFLIAPRNKSTASRGSSSSSSKMHAASQIKWTTLVTRRKNCSEDREARMCGPVKQRLGNWIPAVELAARVARRARRARE